MLVLERHKNEMVYLDAPGLARPIRLTITQVTLKRDGRRSANIGIDADASVVIQRGEIASPEMRQRLNAGAVPA